MRSNGCSSSFNTFSEYNTERTALMKRLVTSQWVMYRLSTGSWARHAFSWRVLYGEAGQPARAGNATTDIDGPVSDTLPDAKKLSYR